MIDTCVHFKKNNYSYIKLISNKLVTHRINYALSIFDNEKTLADRNKFLNNCKIFNNLIPVALLRNVKNIKKEINNIIKHNYKFIKIHPRILKKDFSHKKFYTRVFREIKNTKLNILWCTFDGWEQKASEINQLDFLSKLVNIIPKNKIILMHGGGPNLLKFYEKFRFLENVYLDLSYTLMLYRNTSVENDMIFLLKNFDKRILTGSDYPTFEIAQYIKVLKKLINKSKINRIKKNNILFKNITKIVYDKI
jgi:predicted TIM-barrel fold metal-dependent hydrolase